MHYTEYSVNGSDRTLKFDISVMKKFILSVAALMCSVTLFAQSEIVSTFNEAVTAAKGKNYSEALDLFNKVIDEGIDSEDATVQGLVTKSKSLVSTCYQSMGRRCRQL